jgi:hypothetical protein
MEYLYRPAGRCRLTPGSVISCGLNAALVAASKRAMRVGTGAAAVGAKRLLVSATQDRCSRRERIHDGMVGFVKKSPSRRQTRIAIDCRPKNRNQTWELSDTPGFSCLRTRAIKADVIDPTARLPPTSSKLALI